VILRVRAALAQPEPADLTDDELMDMAEFYIEDNGLLGLHNAGEFARVAIAADRARRPTPQPPTDGEVAEVLQWPAEWSRKQRAQEAEMLCCSAGMTPGKEMQQLVRDARDGMPLQHLHDLISHAIPTPQPPADGEVEDALLELRSIVMGLGQMGMNVVAKRVEHAADLLQRQHPQPVPVSERLPGPEDCDAEGRCWMFDPCDRGWWCYREALPSDGDPEPFTHWLPHWALPAPAIAAELGGP
jgi:hypothetical protein